MEERSSNLSDGIHFQSFLSDLSTILCSFVQDIRLLYFSICSFEIFIFNFFQKREPIECKPSQLQLITSGNKNSSLIFTVNEIVRWEMINGIFRSQHMPMQNGFLILLIYQQKEKVIIMNIQYSFEKQMHQNLLNFWQNFEIESA